MKRTTLLTAVLLLSLPVLARAAEPPAAPPAPPAAQPAPAIPRDTKPVTPPAVENAEAILSVPGVDGCFVGPNDLGISYGERPEQGVPGIIEKAIHRVLAAAQTTGKVAGIQTFGAEEASRRAEQGFRFIGLGSEVRLASAAARRELNEFREQTSRPAQSS